MKVLTKKIKVVVLRVLTLTLSVLRNLWQKRLEEVPLINHPRFSIHISRKKKHPSRKAESEYSMKQFMTYAKAAIAALFLTALVACGGGGGGSAPAPTPAADTTPPVLTLSTASPAAVTTTVVVTSNEDLGGIVSIVVKNGAATLPGSTSLNAGNRGMTWTSTGGALPYGAVLQVSANGVDLSGNTGSLSGTVTTAGATTWWPPATVAAVGVKVGSVNQLPAGCTSFSQQCWKDAIANGTVKFVSTNAKMTGTPDAARSIVFAYFRNTATALGVTGLWNRLPMYADNGSLVGGDINGGGTNETDYVYGTANGLIVHDKVSNLCSEIQWFPPTVTPGVSSNVWATNGAVSCPP